ncbi:carboxymuconolactone decarboxylase family protein [Luteibacter yeojuensis]|uniref:Alkylhydroperoxidase n=1 Tax=Luteibacter yeojuensis TaxID=345309 RepID=A0A0F3KS40_9GAMM|nr:carboxymuconolactone decarboxylase family protein [Luteibacter yeojuensis]KJV33782.1 alkylhydroperoxidase [Luteibacter yeojuensis]
MSTRLDYTQQSPEITRKLVELSMTQRKASTIEAGLKRLVDLRASQMNGCGFCVDMHVKEALAGGEKQLRLHHVAIWRESDQFSPRERAAFAYAEALTAMKPEGVSDALYATVSEQFSEKELSDLTFVVTTINAWNRLNVAFHTLPGSMDKAYGLDKVAVG